MAESAADIARPLWAPESANRRTPSNLWSRQGPRSVPIAPGPRDPARSSGSAGARSASRRLPARPCRQAAVRRGRRKARQRRRRVGPQDVRVDQLGGSAVEPLAHVERRLLLHARIHPVEDTTRLDDRQIRLPEVPEPRDPPLKVGADRRAPRYRIGQLVLLRDPCRRAPAISGPPSIDRDRERLSRGSRRRRHLCGQSDIELSEKAMVI